MGNSTIQIQDVVDQLAALNISPQANPSGYSAKTTVAIANDTMSDLIAECFNFKWNSRRGVPFYTNSWQQDYPMLGLADLGWLENFVWVEINSTTLPLPSDQEKTFRALPVISQNMGSISSRPKALSWDYNKNFFYGVWPGAGKVYVPPVGQVTTPQNGPTAFVDKNGNILLLTTYGTTGTVAPFAPLGSTPITTNVADGSCVWTVCDPLGQGYRIGPLPPANGPTFQINPVYQQKAVKFTGVTNFLDPLPDDFLHDFKVGFKAYCYEYSQDANVRSQASAMKQAWLAAMLNAKQQGDREPSVYGLVAAARPVQSIYGRRRNPMDPLRPY